MKMLKKKATAKKAFAKKPVAKKEYDNTNSGALFPVEDKESESHPDYTGSFTDGDGNEFWLSAWDNESKAGQPYIKIKAKAKEGE